MPITISNLKLANSVTALRELSNLNVPISLALKLRKILRVTQGDLEAYSELLKKLQDKHIKKDAEGNPVHPIGPDGKPNTELVDLIDHTVYNAELTELNNSEIKLEFDKVKSSDFGNVTTKPSVLLDLDWLIED